MYRLQKGRFTFVHFLNSMVNDIIARLSSFLLWETEYSFISLIATFRFVRSTW